MRDQDRARRVLARDFVAVVGAYALTPLEAVTKSSAWSLSASRTTRTVPSAIPGLTPMPQTMPTRSASWSPPSNGTGAGLPCQVGGRSKLL
jgi:hypothetical protein